MLDGQRPAGISPSARPDVPQSQSQPQPQPQLSPSHDAMSATPAPAHGTAEDREAAGRTDTPAPRGSISSSHRDTAAGGRGLLLAPPHILVMAAEVERESLKVRSLYEYGEVGSPDSCRPASFAERLETTPEDPREDIDSNSYVLLSAHSFWSPG